MQLNIINKYLVYEHDGKNFLLDTGCSYGFPIFEQHIALQRIENAVQRHIDGVTNFQPNGRITLTKNSIEIEQNTNAPLPEGKFFLPWDRITQNVPILRMNVNGVNADVIFDTGASHIYSIYNRNYVQGLTPDGKIQDCLAAVGNNGAWADLDAYENTSVQQGNFTFNDTLLMIPATYTEYSLFKNHLQADVIMGVLNLLNSYESVIIDKTGLALL